MGDKREKVSGNPSEHFIYLDMGPLKDLESGNVPILSVHGAHSKYPTVICHRVRVGEIVAKRFWLF